ncbi:alpha/beta fold hydrolase [Alteribacter aurantiacus]|uniref:alpha/beta fold hydrolase n=1 Tax=Alteribacter aurantiacus TaxID=254410 RepID=UPI0004113549|nr:alpha/beta hydrolase [Alteribacter aurantiacus]
MHTVNLNGTLIYYKERGKGDPLIFTHGASWDHKQWEKQLEYFSQYYRVILWDVRGHGQSSLPYGPVNGTDFSDDVIGLMDHLGLEKASLCGLSMGGHISLQTAVRYPKRVSSLILLGTPFTNKYNWYEKMMVPVNRVMNRLFSMNLLGNLQARALSKYNPENKKYIKETVSRMAYGNWVRIWGAVTRMESGDQLHHIECPTLILYGEFDTLIHRQQQTLNAFIKNSEISMIKGAHHATNLDKPDEVNKKIHSFLKTEKAIGKSLKEASN